MNFENKVCLVAGNLGKIKKDKFTCGLGGLIAQQFVAEGAQVVVVDIDYEVSKACATQINGKIKAYECDLLKERVSEEEEYVDERGNAKTKVTWTDNPALEMVEKIVAAFGKIDVVISNFDYFKSARVDNSSEAFYDELKRMNISPTFHLLAAVREQLSLQRKTQGTYAKIVIITSIMGKAGMSLGSIYSAFKGSMVGLTKSLAREFARFANVNGVAHGPLAEKKMQGPKDRVKKNYMATQTEMSNLPLSIKNIAPLARFLASDDAAGITGQVMNVDGGLWLKLES